MTATKLFNLDAGSAKEIPGSATPLEKSLQNVIERNLETMLGIRFLGSEYSTGPKHGGRIDTLGIDENASPVIIEYQHQQSVVKVPWKARRAPAVARRGVRRMAIRVISSDERQSRRPQMSVARRVTRRFRSTAQRVQRRVPGTTRRYFIGPRRVTPPA